MNNFLKNKKGMTLVALVVTIIILLILAGISIATLTGSGLFEKARLAEQESKNKQEEEQSILGDYENTISEYVDGSRSTTYKVKSLIDKNDTLYNKTENGFLFDTPTTYTNITSNNWFINLTDSISNYDYLIIDCDAYNSNAQQYCWEISRMIPAKISNTPFIYQSNQSNWNYVCLKFVDETKIQAASVQSAVNWVSKIRIIDIKGIKF